MKPESQPRHNLCHKIWLMNTCNSPETPIFFQPIFPFQNDCGKKLRAVIKVYADHCAKLKNIFNSNIFGLYLFSSFVTQPTTAEIKLFE